MRDLLPAIELACKSVRAAFGAVGALVDAVVAPKVSAASARSAECGGAVSVKQSAPAPSHPHSAATPRAAVTDPATGDPSPLPPVVMSLRWMGWALPAIWNVLAEHHPVGNRVIQGAYYCVDPDGSIHAEFGSKQQWREHVGPIIADRIGCDPARAAAALASYTPK